MQRKIKIADKWENKKKKNERGADLIEKDWIQKAHTEKEKERARKERGMIFFLLFYCNLLEKHISLFMCKYNV